jgi:hypothetical protein
VIDKSSSTNSLHTGGVVRSIRTAPTTNPCKCKGKCLRPEGPLGRCRQNIVATQHDHSWKKRGVGARSVRALEPHESVRFWRLVDKRASGDCWPWKGGASSEGYGRFKRDGRLALAHRVAYADGNGGIPEGPGYHGFVVMHSCDNPTCCNPAHLSLGTARDNARDMARKGRGSWVTKPRPHPPAEEVK